MKTRIVMTGIGVVAGLVLALAWMRLRTEARGLGSEREIFARSDRALEQEQAAFARRVVEMQLDVAERRRVVLATQSAADRARANVGGYVARLKTEHAGRAPIVRPPPPPATTGGGRFFPELMSDPEYNALYARSTRVWLDSFRGNALRGLGVPEDAVSKAVDLLAEEQASLVDLQSLHAGKEFTKLWTQLHNETAAQLQSLLGADLYARYLDQTEGAAARRQYSTQALDRRLSYSAEPLTDGQKAQLQSYEESSGAPSPLQRAELERMREARKTGTILVDEAKLAFYRSVLTPRQMEAVEELHREAEASLQRRLLPKYEEKKSADGSR